MWTVRVDGSERKVPPLALRLAAPPAPAPEQAPAAAEEPERSVSVDGVDLELGDSDEVRGAPRPLGGRQGNRR